MKTRLGDLPPLPAHALAAYAADVRAAYARAEDAAGGVCERTLRIGDATVRARGPDPALFALLTEALAHRELPADAAPGPADLTLHVWAGDPGPHVAPPSPPGWYLQHRPHGRAVADEIWFDGCREMPAFNSPGIRTAFSFDPHSLYLLDLDRAEAFYWVQRAGQVPYYEAASPFNTILAWWAASRGWLFAHAAAVGTAAGGLLLVGPGGSGKSTSALACLGSPLGYAGDDYCLVFGGSAPRAGCLYNSAKLVGDADLRRFPHLADLVRNPDRPGEDKALLFLHPHYSGHLVNEFPLRALVFPRVTGGPGARLRPIPPAAALAAMAPSTCSQQPGSGHAALTRMAALIRQVPAFSLEVGPDLAAIPAALAGLLAGRDAPPGAR